VTLFVANDATYLQTAWYDGRGPANGNADVSTADDGYVPAANATAFKTFRPFWSHITVSGRRFCMSLGQWYVSGM
jgi:hypothetical protein